MSFVSFSSYSSLVVSAVSPFSDASTVARCSLGVVVVGCACEVAAAVTLKQPEPQLQHPSRAAATRRLPWRWSWSACVLVRKRYLSTILAACHEPPPGCATGGAVGAELALACQDLANG